MAESCVFKSEPVGERTFNVAPLIGVIFVLTLSLTVIMQISGQFAYADLILPSPLESQIQPVDADSRLIINVLAKTKVVKGSHVEFGAGTSYEIHGNIINSGDVDWLVRQIENQQQHVRAMGHKEFFVEIRGDRRVGYEYYQPVMLAASRAGVEKVYLTALGEWK